MKLGKRLTAIEQMVVSKYDHIWDCCCDHGHLGAALLTRQAGHNVHFVDIVPELMAELESKLHRFYSGLNWETHCLDVAKLPLEQYTGRQLVIIAGIGGDLMSHLMEKIYKRHKNINIDFILCPVRHQFTLRQRLIHCDFSLLSEVLIEENQRFYELLFVSTSRSQFRPVHPVGDDIWQSDSMQQAAMAQLYLKKTLEHYQRMQLGGAMDVQHIIDAYLL